jgi:uncharacterized protein involved in outer membrane biogenesis
MEPDQGFQEIVWEGKGPWEMRRVLIYVGIILSVLVGLLSLAVVAVNLIPGNYYKSFIISKVGTKTGRELTIVGDLDIKLFTTFAFKMSGIKVSNAEWGSRSHMISIDNIEGELALFPLLRGILDLTLVVDKSDLLLETHNSGQGNWQFGELIKDKAEVTKAAEKVAGAAQENKNDGGLLLRPFIRKLHIKETLITFFDGKSGDRISIQMEKLHVGSTEDELAIELRGKFNDIPLAFSGGCDSGEFFVANRPAKAKFNGHFGDIKLLAKGTVGPLAPTFDIDVTVAVNTDSVTAFSPLAGRDLPDIGPLSFSVKLTGKDGKYTASELLTVLEDKYLTAEAKGSIADLAALNGLKLEAKVDTDHLTGILKEIGYQSEYKLPDSLNAMVVLEGSLKDLVIKQFQAKIQGQGLNAIVNGEANLTGGKIQTRVVASVKDALKLTGINANIYFAVDSLASLAPLMKQNLPASGPVTLEGRIAGENGLEAPISISSVVESDGVTANFTGSIAEPLAAKGIDITFTAEADSMQKVGKLAGVRFQGQEPLKLEGKFTTGEKAYKLANLHLQVGELDVTGQAALKQPSEPGGRPRLSGKLHVDELDISKQQVSAATTTEPETNRKRKKAKDKVKKDKIFPSKPLPFGPLRSVDAEIDVTVESLKTLRLQFEDLVARLALDNGLLSIKPMKARVGNGNFDGTITLDTRNSPPTLIVDAELVDGTIRDFGGKIHFLADLNGRGDSIAAIMAGLNGQLKFNVSEGTLKKSFMTEFGKGLFSSLNPLDSQKETTELICAIILFDIKDGIADANRKIAAQMTDVTWFGSGEINLKTEKIGFGVNPIPRKSLLHLGNYAKLVGVGGTLAQPKLEIDPTDVAVEYGKYTAAIATGGLTWVADSLWSKRRANTDVCVEILQILDTEDESKEKAEGAKPE